MTDQTKVKTTYRITAMCNDSNEGEKWYPLEDHEKDLIEQVRINLEKQEEMDKLKEQLMLEKNVSEYNRKENEKLKKEIEVYKKGNNVEQIISLRQALEGSKIHVQKLQKEIEELKNKANRKFDNWQGEVKASANKIIKEIKLVQISGNDMILAIPKLTEKQIVIDKLEKELKELKEKILEISNLDSYNFDNWVKIRKLCEAKDGKQ